MTDCKKNTYVTCNGVLTIQLVILNTFTQLNRSQLKRLDSQQYTKVQTMLF